ncbi:sensor histidine kinase [Niabella beijingensis]|uniref:sensor histidine kinase n=1 Tax=Niabella beijingensis TaxID=2872700 RepID=UPI001CBF3F13|nr:histidine kinase [Niabella beijingensis]MBZ4187489.1 histidine kinase [Niabella beijingensis]
MSTFIPMKIYRFSLFIFVLILCGPAKLLSAQSLFFRHLNTANGLLSDQGIELCEDRLGRLWIGTDEGVNVFDGYQVAAYTRDNRSGILNNRIRTILCDRQGTIWIATPAGIQYKAEHTNRFAVVDNPDRYPLEKIVLMYEAPGGILSFTRDSCFFIDQQKRVRPLNGITSIIKERAAMLTASHAGGPVWLLGIRGKTLMVDISRQVLLKELPYHNAWSLCRVSENEWLACGLARDSVVLMNTATGTMELVNNWKNREGKAIAGYGSEIVKIDDDRYAMVTRYHGLYILNVSTRSVAQYTNDPGDASSIHSSFLLRVLVTRNRTLVVHGNGISYTSLDAPPISAVRSFTNEEGLKYQNVVNCFYQDASGQMWIGTNSYLIRWDRTKTVSNFYTYYEKGEGPLNVRTLRAVLADHKNRLWIGAFGAGFGRLRPDGHFDKIPTSITGRGDSLVSSEFHRVVSDRHGNFLVATGARFYLFDPLTNRLETFRSHPRLRKIIEGYTTHFFADRDDNWWFAQSRGLSFYDKKKDSLYTIVLPGTQKDNNIVSVEQDLQGGIYACGYYGVYMIDPVTLRVKGLLNKSSGLETSNVVGLLRDLDGNIWIIGNKGLARYNPQNGALVSFDEKDGLLQSNHRVSAYYLAPDGEVFIGAQTGFNHFYPSQLRIRSYPLQVFITDVYSADTVLNVLNGLPLKLSYRENNLVFRYLTVDYRHAGSVRYRYKLNGFDTGYIYAYKERQARYTNLPAGNYRFEAEASINGKDWYSAARPLAVTIGRAFWNTWWFRLLALLLLSGLAYSFYRWRIRQVEKEAKLRSDFEIKLNELEQKALSTQMNPHFIFNSLNTINSFVNSNDRILANQYISKFSRLVRLTLDNSRAKKIVLRDELEVIKIYVELEQVRFEQRFAYELTTDGVDPDMVEIPSMVIQPFVENAVLHGLLPSDKPGRLTVSVTQKGAILVFVITDNGVGRQAAQRNKEQLNFNRKSHGLDITLKRIESFNKGAAIADPVRITDLLDPDGNSAGTRVEVLLAVAEAF